MSQLELAPVHFISGKLYILDQTELPGEEVYVELQTKEDVYDAIKKLKVRGAPAIGVAAAYGLYVSMRSELASMPASGNLLEDLDTFGNVLANVSDYINSSRPTAANLSWALNRMNVAFRNNYHRSIKAAADTLLAEAMAIHQEDEEACRTMGEYGLSLLHSGMGILTHCNAGTIATSKYGTCLAPIYLGHERGFDFHVYADETRPLLQGARLTAWELDRAGVDVTLICDSMANTIMKQGLVQAVVVGCDRMTANGDGANKIGTSALAVLAKEHGIPFYMFVPTSSIDLNTPSGEEIEIEVRDEEEVRSLWYEKPMAPEGVKIFNPAFDVTPAEYITAIITEKGIVMPPYKENLEAVILGKEQVEYHEEDFDLWEDY